MNESAHNRHVWLTASVEVFREPTLTLRTLYSLPVNVETVNKLCRNKNAV